MPQNRKTSRKGPARKPAGKARYPYPKPLLKQYDVFPLFVLDGGAFFSTAERLGGASAQHFLDALDDDSLLRAWRVGPKIDWDKVYDETFPSPCPTALEQHVWLNRLYFLLPIAQRYFRTRDETWSRLWYSYLSDWVQSNPFTDEGIPEARMRTKYTWFDMQITWRLLVMIHSLQLLAGSTTLGQKQRKLIHETMVQHGRCLYRESRASLDKGTGHGNHFLQQGTALLYAGVLHPELPDVDGYIEVGRAIVKDQLDREILKDGGSIEGSPSYSHFIARLYLDAYLLLKDNGLPGVPGLEQGIRQQYKHLATLVTPQGRTLQVSDSYSMDVRQDLEIVRKLFPLPATYPQRSTCFADSQLIVLRNKRLSIYIDAMPIASHHIHAGKPNILVYAGDEPLLIDSGCCSYDRELWMSWHRSAEAHNVVTVTPADGKGGAAGSHQPVPSIAIKDYAADRAVIEHRYEADGFGYTWTRSVTLEAKAVLVQDAIKASSPAEVRQHFYLAPVNAVLAGEGKQAVAQLKQGDVLIEQADGHSGGAFTLSHHPAIGPDNRVCFSNRLLSRANGREVEMKIRLSLPG